MPAQETVSAEPRVRPAASTTASVNQEGAQIRLTAGDATAEVALTGALVTSYVPHPGKPDVFWMGHYKPGRDRDVWGGIPLCWPWFMTGIEVGRSPFHGFARLSEWSVLGTETPSGNMAILRLGLTDSSKTRELWPHAFRAEYCVELGASLRISLLTENTGDRPFTLEQAFHTYFQVGDVTQAVICGLEGGRGKSGDHVFTQQGPLVLDGPASMMFHGVEGDCTIDDPAWNRTIRIRKSGSRQAVIWNSGPVRQVGGRTTGEPGWQTQLTLEQLKGLDDALVLQPGGQTTLSAEFSVTGIADRAAGAKLPP